MNSQKAQLTQQIKQEARRLGFDLVGVTTPISPPHLDVYRRWLELGRHGEMGYLASETAIRRRSDPLEILPECQSILVTGMNYLPSEVGKKKTSPHIAAYAFGENYHDVMSARLDKLLSYIQQLVGAIPYRIYTDTGPLLEREFAQQSGLGWIGKNTCLIHPKMGSYFFLGEILLGLDLEVDTPFEKDHCGSCTRCIDACPTGCILPDRTLDARRCISYLTIELKTAIPHDLRPLIGDWIFGCDVCQQVCPWNLRFAQTSNEPAFQPTAFLSGRSIPSLLTLSHEDFRTHLRKSPLKRTKWTGILRNTAVVAGNRGGMEVVPLLENLLLDHPNSMVRSHAAWALGRIGGHETRNILEKAKQLEGEPAVMEEITFAIRSIG
jgi:epoxyqueuosine reductase